MKSTKRLVIIIGSVIAYTAIVIGLVLYFYNPYSDFDTQQRKEALAKVKATEKQTSKKSKKDDSILIDDFGYLPTEGLTIADVPAGPRPVDDKKYSSQVGVTIADVPAGPKPEVAKPIVKPAEPKIVLPPKEEIKKPIIEPTPIVQDLPADTITDSSVEGKPTFADVVKTVKDNAKKQAEVDAAAKESKGIWDFVQDKIAQLVRFFVNLFKSEKTIDGRSIELQAQLDEVSAQINSLQADFVSFKDEEGIVWIDHKSKPNSPASFGFYVYLGLAETGYAWNRTIIRCHVPEWINVETIIINTETRVFTIDATSIIQADRGETAWEWIDLPPTQENNELLAAVASSPKTQITFVGRHDVVDWELGESELSALRESLDFFFLLKDKEELIYSDK